MFQFYSLLLTSNHYRILKDYIPGKKGKLIFQFYLAPSNTTNPQLMVYAMKKKNESINNNNPLPYRQILGFVMPKINPVIPDSSRPLILGDLQISTKQVDDFIGLSNPPDPQNFNLVFNPVYGRIDNYLTYTVSVLDIQLLTLLSLDSLSFDPSPPYSCTDENGTP